MIIIIAERDDECHLSSHLDVRHPRHSAVARALGAQCARTLPQDICRLREILQICWQDINDRSIDLFLLFVRVFCSSLLALYLQQQQQQQQHSNE